MVKDKSKPKGAMTAYACFVQVIREEHRKKHPDETVVFAEFSKKCAEKWKTMNPKEKRFDDMAARDKERYNRDMEDYVPADGGKGRKRKRVKDPNMPKRPLSAFFSFCEEERPKVRAANPEWRVSEVAKELGRRWVACTNRPKHEQQATRDKQRYEEEMKQYKAGTFTATKRAKAADSNGHGAVDDEDDDVEDDGDDDEDDE